jgi:hypothetical protein
LHIRAALHDFANTEDTIITAGLTLPEYALGLCSWGGLRLWSGLEPGQVP